MTRELYKQTHCADIAVIGGGMAGLIAAISACRHGAKVILMQDRPVLGGNASSEIRMWIRGAAGKENRETGLLQEIELENIRRNPTLNFSIWDSVLFDFAYREKNLTLVMNCACLHCEMDGQTIRSATGYQSTTQTLHTVAAKIFMDCSGDSVLSYLAGADYRVGREGQAEFDEYGAAEQADACTMGNSCLIQARETDHPCAFTPPDWAKKYPTDESMYLKNHDFIGTGVNFWWIELGGRQDTILNAEELRKELLSVAFGVWDHIKNHGDHGAANWELEWVGFLPGKRESRRCVGDYLLNQRDLEQGADFKDTVAFGGWTMDNHSPDGLTYMGYSSRHITPKVPYPIPYRCLYSRNIDNLLFAGRNISCTHMAMSSTRVMATCVLVGQAAGTAAAIAIRYGLSPRGVGQHKIGQLQRTLLEDGCFLPGVSRQLSDSTRGARFSLPSEQLSVLQNGWERPHGDQENRIMLPEGASIAIDLPAQTKDACLRLALDPDFSRKSISADHKVHYFAMRAHRSLSDAPVRMPAPLAREMDILINFADGSEQTVSIIENARALVRIPLPNGAVRLRVCFKKAWAGGQIGLYACDIAPD